jgi:hypothetical protein
VSYDEGVSWQRVSTTTNNSALIDVFFGVVDVRVAPQNDEIGLWFQQQVTIGSEFGTPDQPSGLALASSFTAAFVDVVWDDQATAASWFVEVLDLSAEVRYSEVLTTNTFRYRSDQAAINGIGREFDINVYAINGNGVTSAASTLRVKNEQVVKLTGVTANGIADQIVLEFPQSAEPDFNNFRVYASKTAGFTANASTLVEPNVRTLMYSFPVVYGETWYFRVAGVDVWGIDELNFSDEISAQSGEIVATVIHDDFIETPMLKANAVTAEKITVPNLSAISAVMGTVTSGIFKTSSLNGYRAEMSSEGDFPIWYGTGSTKDAANGKFYVDKNGTVVAKGIDIYDDNDNLVLSSGGTYSGTISSSNVTGLGAMAGIDEINSGNVSTYIANAALTRAQIGALEVDTADINDLAVETLKIAGRAVNLPTSSFSASGVTLSGVSYGTIQSLNLTSEGYEAVITVSVSIGSYVTGVTSMRLRLRNVTTGEVLWTGVAAIGAIAEYVAYAPVSFSVLHSPAIGANYFVLDGISGSGSQIVTNRSITVLEVKR